MSIKLPNGSQVLAYISGTIHFSASFFLIDVLYVPVFTFNLISVTKLTSCLNFCLTFKSSICLIYDLTTWKVIGSTKPSGGLHVLQKSPTLAFSSIASINTVNSTFSQNTLWHYKLEHPSQTRLSVINKDFSLVTCNSLNMPCDVCHFAKQKQLPFSSSTSVTSQLFQLIHVDIWAILCTFNSWSEILSNISWWLLKTYMGLSNEI